MGHFKLRKYYTRWQAIVGSKWINYINIILNWNNQDNLAGTIIDIYIKKYQIGGLNSVTVYLIYSVKVIIITI